MRIYTYVVEHDLGFAPNPFHDVCTLACCKPKIRKYAKRGDLIIGTGAARPGRQGYLIYWMRIGHVLSFDEYWNDPRFLRKKPVMAGSAMQRYGDNIYHREPATGRWIQEDSFHSLPRGGLSGPNLQRDTGTTERVLVGANFAYWGGAGPRVPDELGDFVVARQGHKCRFAPDRIAAMEAWLGTLTDRGFKGDPADWRFIQL
jgi:putative DNA base modification enzyme with NMAD domain